VQIKVWGSGLSARGLALAVFGFEVEVLGVWGFGGFRAQVFVVYGSIERLVFRV
jgi:hypothetical protein